MAYTCKRFNWKTAKLDGDNLLVERYAFIADPEGKDSLSGQLGTFDPEKKGVSTLTRAYIDNALIACDKWEKDHPGRTAPRRDEWGDLSEKFNRLVAARLRKSKSESTSERKS